MEREREAGQTNVRKRGGVCEMINSDYLSAPMMIQQER